MIDPKVSGAVARRRCIPSALRQLAAELRAVSSAAEGNYKPGADVHERIAAPFDAELGLGHLCPLKRVDDAS